MSQINKVCIPVRMGSKKLQINYGYTLNNFYLNDSDLIEIVVKKLFSKNTRINELKKTYHLYENAFGVERLIGKDENILNLISNQTELKSNVYFIIRKRDKLTRPKQTLNAKKCFAKLKSQKQNLDSKAKETVLYKLNEQMMVNSDEVKNTFLEKIFQNEIILNDQIKKLDSLDRKIVHEKNSKCNQNLFQSVYNKLRHYQKKPQTNYMNQSLMHLIDSAGECSSTSSSRNSSSSKLDTLI